MILDGKETSKKIKDRVKEQIKDIEDKITLLVILVGDDPASQIYVQNKEKACKYVGIKPITWILNKNITQKELIGKINEANNDPSINGILVQLPLPSHLEENIIINTINPDKDVDGLTIVNQGRLFNNQKTIVPATPLGVMNLFSEYKMDISGKNAIVIGRSNLVSKPLAMLLLQKNATVTIAHSKTVNLKEIVKTMDIVISCVGKPNLITADMIKDDAIVIDVGINRLNTKIVGDVNYEEVKQIASAITPVPGGVGPMTIASLIENVVACYKIQKSKETI